MSQHTPMMLQYFEIKEDYPDAFLFYRLGDFYELFYEDATEAARILEITLTARNKHADHPIPMCGVPYHSASGYIRQLVEEGHKVAIAEQIDDPKLTKGMVRREVVQVITPGTITEDAALDSKENNYLASISRHEQELYLIYADISTGEIHLTHTDDLNRLVNELQALQPREIVTYPDMTKEDLEIIETQLQSHYTQHIPKQVAGEKEWVLEQATQAEAQTLNDFFDYIHSVQFGALNHIQPVQRYQLSNYLQMNHFARTQLELTRSLRTQRKKGSLLSFLDRTKTAMGGRLLHQWLEKPLLNLSELSQRHQKVDDLMNAYFERVDLIQALGDVYDLERLVSKISLGSANARDLDQLRHSLGRIPYVNEILRIINQGIGQEAFSSLPEFTSLHQKLVETIVDDPPISLLEGGLIKSGYHEELDGYLDAIENGQSWLADFQTTERERLGLSTLKVSYNRIMGYFIEISRVQSAELDEPHYELKQTLTNSYRFITDELKELETTILNAQENATDLEYHLFVALRDEINQHTSDLQALATQVAELDVLCNFANLSEEENFVRPTLTQESKDIHLVQSRHPVIEHLIGKTNFVANHLTITPEESLLLLTGPNMSGKSTYMRQVAFCIIMNQIGCFVPAQEARLPIIDKIFTRIGSSDDISSGQSTFMVEMIETNTALQEATPNSLLLFDEIGRGTATFDGMALAESIIYYLAQEVQAATIFSTHYHELTQLETDIPSLKNIHVGAEEKDGEVIFLHKILEGPADKSYGIHVAKLAGLPQALIHQSHQVLERLESQSQITAQEAPENVQESLNLFEEEVTPHPILEDLEQIDINQLTPLEAMQKLAELQENL